MNLGKKMGGLPVGVWLAVAALGVGLGLYLRHRAANSSATTIDSGGSSLGGVPTTGDVGAATAGGGVAAPSSGLDPNLEALLANSQSALVASQQTASDLAAYSVGQATGLGAQALGLLAGAPLFNPQAPVVYVVPSSSGGGGGTTTQVTPLATTTPTPTPAAVTGYHPTINAAAVGAQDIARSAGVVQQSQTILSKGQQAD